MYEYTVQCTVIEEKLIDLQLFWNILYKIKQILDMSYEYRDTKRDGRGSMTIRLHSDFIMDF